MTFTGRNFQSRTKKLKYFKRIYRNLVKYIRFFGNINFYKMAVIEDKNFFINNSVIKSLNFNQSKNSTYFIIKWCYKATVGIWS